MTSTLIDLLEESRRRGFLGPGPVEEHLDHARAFVVAAGDPPPTHALDLGAGGGLPGLVLAATVWPDARWTFLDAQLRRTAFLEWAVAELGLGERVRVIHGRAEEVGRNPVHRGCYDLVTARSFGPPAVTAECGLPLLVLGGRLVVSEPPDASLAERWPAPSLEVLGAAPAVGVVAGDPPVHLVRIDLVGPVPDTYPRRTGRPAKAPLFPTH